MKGKQVICTPRECKAFSLIYVLFVPVKETQAQMIMLFKASLCRAHVRNTRFLASRVKKPNIIYQIPALKRPSQWISEQPRGGPVKSVLPIYLMSKLSFELGWR